MLSVVFDMDGVLFDTQKIYSRCWQEAGDILQIKNFNEPALLCIGRNRNDQRELLQNFYDNQFPFDEFLQVKDKLFKEKLEKDGVPLMQGTKEILQFLKERNAKVALASSTRYPQIMEHLNKTGLKGYFNIVVGGDMVTHSKPAPDIYQKACELLQTEPNDTFAVEDSYNGVRAAVAAGMKTVMIPDVLPSTAEMENIIYKKCDSLIDFMHYLEAVYE